MHKRISEIINKNFHEFWRVINSNKYLFHVLKGGRASAKSTHIAIWLVLALMKYPVTCLCIRKVGNTLTEPVITDEKRIWRTPLYYSEVWQMRNFIQGLKNL